MFIDEYQNPTVRTRPNLQRFINWLTMQNPNERYDWSDSQNCACAKFYAVPVKDGITDWIVENRRIRDLEGVDLNMIAGNGGDRTGWTYGALLERARRA